MMLVDARFRRQGVARALLRRAVAYLKGLSIECIALDATPAGREVYLKIGFEDGPSLHRWERPGEAAAGLPLAEAETCHLPALDVEAFGVDRSAWLGRMATDARIAVHRDGYGMLRPGLLANQLGPIVARNDAAAEDIVAQLLGGTRTRHFWDIPDENAPARRLAASLGFQPVRSLIRMSLGSAALPGCLELQYGIGDPATG
jgi:hypothetical protein